MKEDKQMSTENNTESKSDSMYVKPIPVGSDVGLEITTDR